MSVFETVIILGWKGAWKWNKQNKQTNRLLSQPACPTFPIIYVCSATSEIHVSPLEWILSITKHEKFTAFVQLHASLWCEIHV